MEYHAFEFDTVTLENGEIKTEPKSAKSFLEDLDENTTLEMVYIPSGTFMMGSSDEDDFAGPRHQVSLCAFHMGKFEITQKQWEAIMHNNPSEIQGADLPVENISWCDAIEFCNRLSTITRRQYRLPSEAEWEYACRAGTTTAFNVGSAITPQLANYWDSNIADTLPMNAQPPSKGCVASYSPEGVQFLQTMRVGSFFPNSFGLFDMHCNVFEFCQDAWHDDYTNSPNNGDAWGSGKDVGLVVIRGGSYNYYEDNCQSAFRSETGMNYRYHGTGFRVALCGEDTDTSI